MAIYKTIEGGTSTFQKKLIPLQQTNLFGTGLKFTKVDRTNLSGSFLGNLFSSFNLPITIEQISDFTTGVFSNTAFQYLNQDKIIIAEVPKNSYGELIDGKTINFTVPTTSGNTTIYSTFFKNSILTTAGHMIYSDPNQQSVEFGQNFNVDELPGQSGLANPLSGYSSNIAFLFADSIQKPENNSNYSWASNSKYFVNQTNLPTGVVGSKFPANYSSSDGIVDIPVGIAYLDKGFMVITNPAIVNNFDYSSGFVNGSPYAGDANFENLYFTSGATLSFQSFVTEFVQNITCIALPNEFYESNNPTFIEAYGVDNLDNNPVAITEIGLYNMDYECIAIAKSSLPLAKDKSSVLPFNITIKV